ncbi:MAG: hypothetical protein H6975_02760 [Gammaproteobacteria bacterium]|nr:hypothetical protein [Gammaproteobacteria bacterium]
MPKFFMLKIQKSTVLLELTINDAPLVLPSRQSDIDTGETINVWIQPGDNVLGVYLTWPEGTPYQPGLARCGVRLEALEEGQSMGDSIPLVDFVWPLPAAANASSASADAPAEPPAPTEYYPYEARIRFPVAPSEAPPSRLWQEALPIPWDAKQKPAIIQRLALLHKALDQKDLKAVMKFLDFKAVDAGGAHYLAPDTARMSQQEFFEYLFSIDDWGMEPLEPENLDFHLLADDRVLLVSGSGMAPALSSSNPAGPKFRLPIYFALIQNVWLIVR